MLLELIILFPILGGIMAYASSRKFGGAAAEISAICGAFLSLIIAAISTTELISGKTPLSSLNGILYLDSLSAFFTIITLLVSLIVFIYSVGYIRKEVEEGVVPQKNLGLYYALLSFFLAAMLTATLASNLIVIWAAIEATTLASAFLIGFYNKRESIEAAWKFFLINSVGITIALLGILFLGLGLHNSGAAMNFDISALLGLVGNIDPVTLKIAFALVIVGYGTKAGLVPMHTWLPDAHSQAPTPVSAILSGVLLNIAFYGIIRMYQITLGVPGVASFASSLLVFFGIISLGLASMRLFYQGNIKRMLAYSSVENMGIAVLAFGVGGPIGIFAALFHLAMHSFAKPLAFCFGGILTQAYGTKEIKKISGVICVMPAVGILFILTLMGLAGNLPFGMFFSEIALIGALFSANNIAIAALVILFITIAFGTMLYKGSSMLYGEKPDGLAADIKPHISMIAAVILLLVFSLYLAFGLSPIMIELIGNSAKMLI